jgi:hypothetical protein
MCHTLGNILNRLSLPAMMVCVNVRRLDIGDLTNSGTGFHHEAYHQMVAVGKKKEKCLTPVNVLVKILEFLVITKSEGNHAEFTIYQISSA